MNWKTERNAYDIDIQNNTATFDVRSKCDRASEKFTIDLDDFCRHRQVLLPSYISKQ